MYHRVIADTMARQTDSNPGIVVSSMQFDKQMRTLRERFNPLSLAEFRQSVESCTPPPNRSCLVTFDDGWIDNYDIAFPILRKYSIPAVVFLPCNYISTDQTFWQEEMLMRLTRMSESTDKHTNRSLQKLLATRDDGYPATVSGIRLFVISLKDAPYKHIEEVLQQVRILASTCSDGGHYNRHLSWDQVREMKESGIDFASHALSHQLLSRLDAGELERELTLSKRIIEEETGESVFAIAYPNGDYDPAVLHATKAAGYTLGFSTRHGLFSIDDDPLTVPRFNVHGHNGYSPARFMCTIGGLF
jgi:peptidoglycan/xylan/chitin deacetylase (PgdA/CDA1 family)